jgi:hypothetical protein
MFFFFKFWNLVPPALVMSECARSPASPDVVHWDDFEIITCRGVNQSLVGCEAGVESRFDGALVCSLSGGRLHPPPAELCARLPRGCEPFIPPTSPSASAAAAPASAPRCDPADPDCGPQLFGGECLSSGSYVWGGPRKPIYSSPFGGPCESDGDCSIDVAQPGCLACDSRFAHVSHRGCRTPRGAEWNRTFCGCVEHRCDFFRQ